MGSIELKKTYIHILKNICFDNLDKSIIEKILKDGRAFSHFIEKWIENNYPLDHVEGCKQFDFIDRENQDIKYDEKTFTSRGCSFCPSNMLGQGRKFDKEVFENKSKKLIFCIVSNINFPEIKIKFIKGEDLIINYPLGKIPIKDHDIFFS